MDVTYVSELALDGFKRYTFVLWDTAEEYSFTVLSELDGDGNYEIRLDDGTLTKFNINTRFVVYFEN
jgi:hypothetical protein